MKLDAVAALAIKLGQLSNRFEAGETACRGAADAFEAEAVVVWLPGERGPCRAEDLFVAGDLVPRSSILDVAQAVRSGALERWFSAHAIPVTSVAPIGSSGRTFGLVAVGWRSTPAKSLRLDAFLALVAEQLRAVLARGEAAELMAAASDDAEQLPVVRALRKDVGSLRQEVARLQHTVPEDSGTSARQRTIIESTSDYVFVKDVWGRYVEANAAYLRALGLPAVDVLGKRDGDMFPPEVAAETAGREQKAQVSGQPLEDEATMVLGGRRRHLLVRRSPWRTVEGHTVGVVTVATDITDRKDAEVARQAALEELRAASEQTQALLKEQMRLSQRGSAILELTRRLTAETDSEAIYRIVLDSAERQLDGARAILVNCDPSGPTFTVRTRGPRAKTLRHLQGLSDGAKAGFGTEVVAGPGATSVLLDAGFELDAALIADGMRASTLVPVAVGGRPLPVLLIAWPDTRHCPPEDLWFTENLGVQLGLALKNARLYSDLRQSLLSLREAQQEVARTQRVRALGDLASGIAHQFNNSLTSILGLADWLLFTLPAGSAGLSELEAIRAAASDTAALVKRLRGFGRSSSGAEACELLDPAESIRLVPDLIRSRLDDENNRRSARYDVVMELSQVPLVRFAPSELREILLHLASNAIEAMPRGGRMTLRSAESEGGVQLSVTDEGEGIPPELRSKLFAPFFTTKGGDHVGLGLSVCRGIAERHGATICLASEPGRGTTATLVLPVPAAIPAAPLEATAGDATPRAAGASNRLRVLLVDDQEDILEAVSEMVSALSHHVDSAQGGLAAMAMLAARDYDVLLTDLGMPGMDGRELARRAAASCPGIRVILLTGWSADVDDQPPAAVSAVLAKPVTMKALRGVLDIGVRA
jgi:PAS domain S-box-containing protein